MPRSITIAIWLILALAVIVPLTAASMSPLLAWRDPVYIAAGFAGIAALALMLFQPLLATAYLPGLNSATGRYIHKITGCALVVMLLAHVGGLWVTSPPDVIDALLFVSPTPFSLWGVIAMWCVFLTAALALARRGLRLQPRLWRSSHRGLAAIIVSTSVLHAMLIEGTMGLLSKSVLCVMVVVATATALFNRKRHK